MSGPLAPSFDRVPNSTSHANDTGEALPQTEDTASRSIAGHRPGLADWLDLLSLLRLDEGVRDAELRRRDRALGARVQASPGRPERWLTAWVSARQTELGASGDLSGRPTTDAVRWSVTLLGIAGLFFGATAAWGALSFQPQGRINVVAVLGVLVGLPTLLLGLALVNALPTRLRRAIPLIGPEPEGGGWLQPARWALRALPAQARERLDAAFGRGLSIERLAAPVQRWLLLSASQGAAVAFQLGALGATLALVVFSDLSFGWSTTLEVDAASAHRVTTLLAAPWAWLWSEAVPSIELLERTRFFRIASQPTPGVAPELYGQWWRFVVAAVATYGLLPRLAFFVFVRARLRRGLVRAMLDAPGARRLLRRMQDPLVETMGTAATSVDDARVLAAAGAAEERGDSAAWPEQSVVIIWAEAVAPGHDLRAGETPTARAPIAAGGRLTPRDDLAAAERAASLAIELDCPVALVVRGYEPPMLELVDFVAELRRRLGDGREIVVGLVDSDPAHPDPIHPDADHRPPVDSSHARVWQRRLAATGDPWLRCTSAVPWIGGRTSGDDPDEHRVAQTRERGGEGR